ncbi:pitrilysin family protein [soil metagenome]
MKKGFFYFGLMALAISASAQKIAFTEYTLKNGLHVILHQDNTAPVVAVSVMYHVGSKDELTNRTGFAHFFEHLLFEGSDNIKRGEFFKIVSSNGGQNNANTSQDRTFYYEVFPSNQLATGLWLESERMLHPVINEIGVKTQNEVVKEEKRLRYDNRPYGNLVGQIMKRLFTKHPYHWIPIGSMADLDAATLAEFQAFNKKFYTPVNSVLSIAGDIDIAKTKALVESYFADIPSGTPIVKATFAEDPITKEIIDTAYDNNIQNPAIMAAYRIPGRTNTESKAMEMLSAVLSTGNSSRMYKKMVDEKKNSLQVGSFNYALEDYGAYITYAFPNNNTPLDTLLKDIDEEIVKLQTQLISEEEFTKLQNQFENDYLDNNNRMINVAENLANGYTFYKNTDNINTELNKIRKITRQDIQLVAKKYLNKNQRVVLYYLPKK